jgi:hypothetical protein
MDETEKIIQLCFILFSQCVAYSGTIALERGDSQENLELVQTHGEIQESKNTEAEETHACVKSCIDQRQAKITLRDLQHVAKIVAYQWMIHDHLMKPRMNFQETGNLVCVQQAIKDTKKGTNAIEATTDLPRVEEQARADEGLPHENLEGEPKPSELPCKREAMQDPGIFAACATSKKATHEGAVVDAVRDRRLISGGRVSDSIDMMERNVSGQARILSLIAKRQAEVAGAALTKEEKNTTANPGRKRVSEGFKTNVMMRESEMRRREGEQTVKRDQSSCPGPAKVGLNHEEAAPPRRQLADAGKMRIATLLGRAITDNEKAKKKVESQSAQLRADREMQGRRITESAKQEENNKVCVNEARVSGDGRDSTSRAGYGSKELDEVFGTPRSPSQRQHAIPVTVNRIDYENLRNEGFMEMGKGEFTNLNSNKETVSVQQAESPDVIGVEGIDTHEGSLIHSSVTEGTRDPARGDSEIERIDAAMRARYPELYAAWDLIQSSDEDEQSVDTQDPTKTVKVEGSAGASTAPKKVQRECNSLMYKAGELIVELDETIGSGEINNLPHFGSLLKAYQKFVPRTPEEIWVLLHGYISKSRGPVINFSFSFSFMDSIFLQSNISLYYFTPFR